MGNKIKGQWNLFLIIVDNENLNEILKFGRPILKIETAIYLNSKSKDICSFFFM